MFNNQKNQPAKRPKPPVRESAVTILTSGCHFNGKLYCRGSSRIGGRIEGQVVSEGLLIIEEEAQIDAEISAEETIIQGTVRGRLVAKTRVELCASADFEGDIETPALIVNEGAKFNGNAKMSTGRTESAKSPKLVDRRERHYPDAKPGKSDKLQDQPDVAVLKVPEVNPSS